MPTVPSPYTRTPRDAALKAQLRTPSQIRRAGAKHRPVYHKRQPLRPVSDSGYLSIVRLLRRILPKEAEE